MPLLLSPVERVCRRRETDGRGVRELLGVLTVYWVLIVWVSQVCALTKPIVVCELLWT